MLLPVWISLSHSGKTPLTCTASMAPPLIDRHLNHTPFAGVTYTYPNAAFTSAAPKYINPAFDSPLVLVKALTCPLRIPSLSEPSDKRLNRIAVPSNPGPPPATVQSNGGVESAIAQPVVLIPCLVEDPGNAEKLLNVAVLSIPSLCALTASPARALAFIAIVCPIPICVQLSAFEE